ncbi:hypothetical protein SELMODRAFT_431270 [Selaginella moellendorffii]|uniref:Uncharacterized protein n=1 Tax=Selaginella moellendorffii TaxID=88036 RepID=D8TC29_SELML|nr:hypothetical protein SELMODRAFT_431270 [Selaginella moellendorffii]
MKNRRLAVLQPASDPGKLASSVWKKLMRLNSKPLPFTETRYNQQYTKETETARDTATSKRKDAMLRHELEYLRSGNELELLSLLPNARDEEEPSDRARGTTGRRLDKRLDENTQAQAIGLEEIPRPWKRTRSCSCSRQKGPAWKFWK